MTLVWPVPRLCSERTYPEDMEGAFEETHVTIDHGLVVGARATRAGVRAEGSIDSRSLAGDGHDVGDRSSVSGPFHAGGICYTRGRLLPDGESRERGGEDPCK